jgi:hypothetical protein
MNDRYFYYIITGDTPSGYPRGAEVFKTPMGLFEFRDWVYSRSEKLHESGKDEVFKHGIKEFVNPQIFNFSEYKNYMPAIIET